MGKQMVYPFSISKWTIAGEEGDYNLEERCLLPIIIGKDLNMPEEDQRVIEFMYSDIAFGVIENRYKADVKIGQVPPVTVSFNGNIIPHNDNFDIFKQDIADALGEIPTNTVIKALTGYALKKSSTEDVAPSDLIHIKALGKLIQANTGISYNPKLILEVAKEIVHDLDMFKSEVRDNLSSLSYNELMNIMGEVKEYLVTGECKDESVNTLISTYGVEEVKNQLNAEIADRVYFRML